MSDSPKVEQKTNAAPRCTEQQLLGIRDALLTLGITGASLLARICEDIERGLMREARTQLNFVDKMLNANIPLCVNREGGAE
jgi:hypothetical protein